MTLVIASTGLSEQQENYRATIVPLIGSIRRTNSGRTLLRYIENSSRRVRITPFGPRRFARNQRPGSASAIPSSWQAAATFGSRATAAGSGAEIAFSVRAIRSRWHHAGGQDDQVLFHELCHALRYITGALRLSRNDDDRVQVLPMSGGWDTVEEFFAIMVSNIYSSETGRALQGGHNQSVLRDPDVLRVRPYSTRLNDFRRRMPKFTTDLAEIPQGAAPFNPFRDY